MNTHIESRKGVGKAMEILVPLGILALWLILQAWVLPRFGIRT